MCAVALAKQNFILDKEKGYVMPWFDAHTTKFLTSLTE
jgi:hypothetical protein